MSYETLVLLLLWLIESDDSEAPPTLYGGALVDHDG